MWDYKLELPTLPLGRTPTEAEKTNHASQMAELIKVAVSFYNSFGGYLVAGIRDQPRETIGFDRFFDDAGVSEAGRPA
jgi:predicted HTH transcriptional regulator